MKLRLTEAKGTDQVGSQQGIARYSKVTGFWITMVNENCGGTLQIVTI